MEMEWKNKERECIKIFLSKCFDLKVSYFILKPPSCCYLEFVDGYIFIHVNKGKIKEQNRFNKFEKLKKWNKKAKKKIKGFFKERKTEADGFLTFPFIHLLLCNIYKHLDPP